MVLHFGDMQKQELPSALMGASTRRRLKKALEEALEANRAPLLVLRTDYRCAILRPWQPRLHLT